jgi:hypothetical protein
VGDELAFVVRQMAPVHNDCGEVDIFDCPEGGFGFLLHVPDVRVLDGEQDKAMRVLL